MVRGCTPSPSTPPYRRNAASSPAAAGAASAPLPGAKRSKQVLRDIDGAAALLDVQADLLSHIATRAVVPLLPEDDVRAPIGELNPVTEIKSKRHVTVTQALAAIPGRELKRAVASAAEHHDRIVRAFDMLLVGF